MLIITVLFHAFHAKGKELCAADITFLEWNAKKHCVYVCVCVCVFFLFFFNIYLFIKKMLGDQNQGLCLYHVLCHWVIFEEASWIV